MNFNTIIAPIVSLSIYQYRYQVKYRGQFTSIAIKYRGRHHASYKYPQYIPNDLYRRIKAAADAKAAASFKRRNGSKRCGD